MEFSDAMKEAMPDPVFGCGIEGCSVEVSYPAEDLRWCESEQKWICHACAEALDLERSMVSLEDCQKAVGWVRRSWGVEDPEFGGDFCDECGEDCDQLEMTDGRMLCPFCVDDYQAGAQE